MSIVGAGSGGDEEHLLLADERSQPRINFIIYFAHLVLLLRGYYSRFFSLKSNQPVVG